jgi:acetyl-CoA carboxylase biotin carboxylase subunit
MENSNSNESTDMVVVAAFIDYLQKISSTNEPNNDFALPQSRWKKIPYINHF